MFADEAAFFSKSEPDKPGVANYDGLQTAQFIQDAERAEGNADDPVFATITIFVAGEIVESGRYDELMALGGRYAEMYTLQAERFAAVPASAGEPFRVMENDRRVLSTGRVLESEEAVTLPGGTASSMALPPEMPCQVDLISPTRR